MITPYDYILHIGTSEIVYEILGDLFNSKNLVLNTLANF